MLHSESAMYAFRADSMLGFLGSLSSMTSPLDQADVRALVVADNYAGNAGNLIPRRRDGSLSCTPRFYRRSVPNEEYDTVTRFDVASQSWGEFVEVDGMFFLPFLPPGLATRCERQFLECQLHRRFQWGEDIFVGTETMLAAGGLTVTESTRHVLEKSYDTSIGFDVLEDMGIRPVMVTLPRSSIVTDYHGHEYLQHTLNAAGTHKWDKQLLDYNFTNR
jgi:hypothetical protein